MERAEGVCVCANTCVGCKCLGAKKDEFGRAVGGQEKAEVLVFVRVCLEEGL